MPNTDTLAKEFLSQKRIAVAGVSRTGASAANGIYDKLKATGHTVFAVNPKATKIGADPCYPTLSAIPGGVDGVVIVTTPEVSEQIVQQAIDAHVPRVWMHRSLDSGSVSQAAVELGQQHGLTVIAGGCPMMYQAPVDFGHVCIKWYARATHKMPA